MSFCVMAFDLKIEKLKKPAMPALDLNFITQTLGLPPIAVNAAVGKITTDSRIATAGDVFVALAGEKHDGHDFVPQVSQQGAYAPETRADRSNIEGCLNVADTLAALQTLAQAWRLRINPQVFGITGSSGKTTVKEMLAAVLRQHAGDDAVLATAGNFNNHIGLPLTLLQLKPQHRFAVIEMGMNHFGELALLTRLARPDWALVNNALRAHVGCGFDGVADIARAKSEIYQGLPENGIGFIPCEDAEAAVFQAALQGKQQRTFGVSSGDVYASDIELKPLGVDFVLHAAGVAQPVQLPVPGRHNVHNAVAAAALALAAEVPGDTIAQALAGFANIKGRLQQKRSAAGALLIDDSYNANPDSFKAAIDVLAAQPAPRVLVMGAIGELGADAPQLHAEVGAYARARGIEHALFTGADARFAAEAYGQPQAFFEQKDALAAAAQALDQAQASFLVKGSRFMQMETVVAALQSAPDISKA